MSERPITEKYLKACADNINEFNATFPDNNINHILVAKCVSCDAQARVMDYVMTVPENMINKVGSAHGGFIAAISDELMGNAVHFYGTANDPQFAVTTINMTFNCLKPMFTNDEIKLHVVVRHMGKRTASATCEIFRGDVLCAFSSESFAVIKTDKVPDFTSQGANK